MQTLTNHGFYLKYSKPEIIFAMACVLLSESLIQCCQILQILILNVSSSFSLAQITSHNIITYNLTKPNNPSVDSSARDQSKTYNTYCTMLFITVRELAAVFVKVAKSGNTLR